MSDYNIKMAEMAMVLFLLRRFVLSSITNNTVMDLTVTRRVSDKKQELSTLRAQGITPGFGEVRIALPLFFVCCVFVL